MNRNQYPGAVDPALRDLWIELELGPDAYTPGRGVSSAGSGPSSGSGSGSCGAGYGLCLVVPDRFSCERIARIMRDLCEADKKRGK